MKSQVGVEMDSHERLNRRAIEQEWMLDDRSSSVWLVLLVVLSSFAAGLIPLAYASTQENVNPASKAIVASEAGVWSVLGEK